jgi:hypothetical protein
MFKVQIICLDRHGRYGNMKKQLLALVALLASSLLLTGVASGAKLVTHCVSNATQLQTALNTAGSNTAPDLIKVVQGTYNGNFHYSSSQGYSIELRGGYTAGCASRTLNPANTILNGSGANIALNLSNTKRGNVTVQGFTIQNGHSVTSGGGIYARSESPDSMADDVTITDNIITGNIANQSGGGVYAQSDGDTGSGTVTISNNIVTGNISSDFGGGVYAESKSNSGSVGAITISNNTITENTGGTEPGGGMHANSFSQHGTSGAIAITSNTVSDNFSGNWGGGISANSSGIVGSGSITVEGNTVSNNTGSSGGARISSSTSSGTAGGVTLINNVITDNNSDGVGGVYASSSAPSGTAGAVTLVNNVIAGNTSDSYYGALYASSYSNSGSSGAITLTNNTITENTATDGDGGVQLRSSHNNAYVYNNIIRGNSLAADIDLVVVTAYGYNNNYSTLYGSWNGGSGGNIDVDPQFIGAGDYRLSSVSPCIDAGLNTAPSFPVTDIEGNARMIDGDNDLLTIADMGAYEFRCATDPVNISGTLNYYATLPAAYTAAGEGNTLLALAGIFTGPMTFADGISVTLKGGYACGFTTVTGFSVISDSLTLGPGTVTMENMIIK